MLETIDYLDSYHRGYVSYKYGEIDMDDLQAYLAALDASPYFRRAGSMDSSVYQLIYFVYTGPDHQITQMDGTAAWNSNLSVYICKPRGIRSEFYIYEYPGFTVNSEKAAFSATAAAARTAAAADMCTSGYRARMISGASTAPAA